MIFLDMVMFGKVSFVDLVGVVIGLSFWIFVYIGFVGILMVVILIVVQFLGVEKKQ